MHYSRFPLEWIETLKRKNDIVTIISKYIPVVKKGNSLWARCPFHHEKTPSFSINEAEQYYHCFGCGVGGDVIKFVSEMESCSRFEAIKILAENANMELPMAEDSEKIIQQKKERDLLLSALDEAKKYYIQNLYEPTSKIAQNYIRSRNLNKRDIERFEIGYSKDGYSLINHLTKKGFSLDVLQKAGLISNGEGKPYDFLCGRLIFPIIDGYGNCIGYSGRILTKDTDRAKYKNTSQTPVFNKGSIVYAINLLKEYKKQKKLDKIVIVEGQMDVITMHHYGFENAIACMGTAFTERHATELKRLCDNIVLCFDGDGAGIKATLRAIPILKSVGLNVSVVSLPDGADPDEYLKKFGQASLNNLIENPLSTIEFQLKIEKKKFNLNKTNEKAQYVRNALEIINKLGTSSEQDVYLNLLNKETRVPIEILRKDLNINNSLPNVDDNDSTVLKNQDNGNIKAIKSIIYYLKTHPEMGKKYSCVLEFVDNPIYLKILQTVLGKINEELTEEEEIKLKEIDEIEDFEKNLYNEQYVKDSILNLRSEHLKRQQIIITSKINECNDDEQRKKLLEKLQGISKDLKISKDKLEDLFNE